MVSYLRARTIINSLDESLSYVKSLYCGRQNIFQNASIQDQKLKVIRKQILS